MPFKGGVGRYTSDMAAMLHGPGFPVTVFTETGDRSGTCDRGLPYRVIRKGRDLFARHPWLNLGLNAWSGMLAVMAARSSGAEWFVATGKRSVYNAAFLFPLLRGMRLAVILHGSEWSDIRDAKGRRGRMLREGILRLCAAAKVIVFPNRFTRERFLSLPGFDPAKAALLYPIVDPERVKADPALASEYRARYLPAPVFSLITIARLTPRKGQDQTLRALGRFAREVGDFRYFIVGNGSYRPTLEKIIAEEGLQGKVHILSGLDDAQAYSLMSLCDLYAMPNREDRGAFEGFGIAFLEGNVLGLPALAGRNGGSVEAVQDGANGLLCRGEDPEDIFAALKRFNGDTRLREGLRGRCREYALERYSFEQSKPRYRSVFGSP